LRLGIEVSAGVGPPLTFGRFCAEAVVTRFKSEWLAPAVRSSSANGFFAAGIDVTEGTRGSDVNDDLPPMVGRSNAESEVPRGGTGRVAAGRMTLAGAAGFTEPGTFVSEVGLGFPGGERGFPSPPDMPRL